MTVLIDNIFIFILSIFLFSADTFGKAQLVSILLSFSIICLKLAVQNNLMQKILDLIYLLLCFFQPSLLIEMPAVFYLNFYKKNYQFLIPSVALCLFHSTGPDFSRSGYFIMLAALSCYLGTNSAHKNMLTDMVHKLRDNSVEHEIILKEKNQKLIDKQNDELYIAILQERNRIAREIHDNVGHMLSRSILQVGAMQAICQDENLKPHLTDLNATLNDAMNNIRNSVHDLHDEAIQLEDAVRSLLHDFTFCKVDFTYKISSKPPKEIKYCFLAVIKEALNNVVKHSNADRVTLSLKEQSTFYQLIIKDNGTQKNGNMETTDGIGLKSMKERVDAVKGIIHISWESGMRIFITVPK